MVEHSSIDYLKKRLVEVEAICGFRDLDEIELIKYKELRKKLLLAEIELCEFLNSRGGPVSIEERERAIARELDSYVSCTHGDGMCEDYALDELRRMSDWEFSDYLKEDET